MGETVWWIYMLRCGDGSLYTGIATDVDRRFSEHESQGPKAAKYLRGRLPLEIVFRKEIGTRSEASKEELRIKRLGVKGKLALVDEGVREEGHGFKRTPGVRKRSAAGR